MIVSLRKWMERIKFILIFLILTLFLYHFAGAVTAWLGPTDRYREPLGRSVKVFNTSSDYNGEQVSLSDRLRFFYWYGE
ncbi:hypothetical protein SY83_18960 [Paenibacillus swuensis]|uniref:DUF4227 domain-containing protein n=1 Tax=Paenibacillus swuensis TaxID=1178515 RepID=A0A172TLT1_9BACL|nr:DUF4227 family protein [Paenibacillus swuensis]ANE48029.1 hypothetical protein SY83_18960 [Paenibacillus swuensis]